MTTPPIDTSVRRVCPGTAAARNRAARSARRAALVILVPDVLADRGPSTTKELADTLPPLPWLHYWFGGPECDGDGNGGCGGHGAELKTARVWSDEVRAVLRDLEARGEAARVVLQGVQSHLWSVVAP